MESIVSNGRITVEGRSRPVSDVASISDTRNGTISIGYVDGTTAAITANPGDIFSLSDQLPWARVVF